MFELVKNAYDADASRTDVWLVDAEELDRARIIIEDDGCGMDYATVTGVWLEPGTDNRARQRQKGLRTPRFGRLPLGEKGIGRFAVHKIGRSITLTTRSAGQAEVVVHIDWAAFDSEKYLKDVRVSVVEREPKHFSGNLTGTRLEISGLRDTWTRGMARDLHRAVTSICSPFEEPEDFRVSLHIEPDREWLKGLLDISDVLELALYRATCLVEGASLQYSYDFTPLPGMDRVSGRHVATRVIGLKQDLGGTPNRPLEIGPVRMDLSIFDRDPQVLNFLSDRKGLTDLLNNAGGIRVYRDRMRVYDYGELGNDWLDLGGRRVNVPTARISNNIVIGAVSLRLRDSADLIEKTNREGFVENDAYLALRATVLQVLSNIETERNTDKERIRAAYSKGRAKEPVLEDLAELRSEMVKTELPKPLIDLVDQVQKQFIDVRDRLLVAANAGLNLSMVVHELEKAVGELRNALDNGAPLSRIETIAQRLSELMEGYTFLIRGSGFSTVRVSSIIRQAVFNAQYRLDYHKIGLIDGIKMGEPDLLVRCSKRLITATLMNLIDNSIWWLANKGHPSKLLYIGTRQDYLRGRPAIVVADNGPGFIDPPEILCQPFISRKPDGMGLGLHLANEVMKAHHGSLDFPSPDDVELPAHIAGAVVALVFGGEK